MFVTRETYGSFLAQEINADETASELAADDEV